MDVAQITAIIREALQNEHETLRDNIRDDIAAAFISMKEPCDSCIVHSQKAIGEDMSPTKQVTFFFYIFFY